MIPVLNNGIESGLYKNTLADQLLSEYQLDLKIDLSYGGKVHSIPVWKFIERYLRIVIHARPPIDSPVWGWGLLAFLMLLLLLGVLLFRCVSSDNCKNSLTYSLI